jgi:hypothetical protein
MAARVAVLSDAVSHDSIFPIWHRYYGGLFGFENLFLITYAGKAAPFRDVKLGGLIELPMGYEDSLRQAVISRFVSALLPCYETVIRVDIDEFLVVDPRVAPSLAGFVNDMKGPYITARGFDVIQLYQEPSLPEKLDGPLLENRAFAYPNTALNKTCIVKHPVTWSTGFHWSTVYPKFGPVFMLHMKRIDINWQIAWSAKMFESVKDNPTVNQAIKDYYSPSRDKIEAYHKDVGMRPHLSGIDSWYRDEIISEYLSKLEYRPDYAMYSGEYGHELVLCEIIPEWKLLF